MLKRFRPALRPVSRQLSGLARLAGANGGAARCFSTASLPPFEYEELFQSTGPLGHPFRKLTSDHVSTVQVAGKQVLQVEPEALRLLERFVAQEQLVADLQAQIGRLTAELVRKAQRDDAIVIHVSPELW